MDEFNTLEFISNLVRFKSISADPSKRQDTRDCAEFLKDSFKKLGFESRLYETKMNPIVFASRNALNSDAKLRVLCYGHYDVQPVDPIEKWVTPPFEPSIRDAKIYARGTADNKGPTACIIGGLMNFLSKNPDAPIDIAFMLEGEEEIGSVNMAEFIENNKELISSYDYLILSDTSSSSVEDIVITIGLRGTASMEVKFKGANTDVHSGMYGGMIYNPIQAMVEVCASLHNKDGFVNIDGFYDGVEPMSDWEKSETAKAPFNEEKIKQHLGISELYKQGDIPVLEAGRALPTLEWTGIGGGYQGEGSKSVIASECFCKICCRSAAGQSSRHLLELVMKAIKERCPKAIQVTFDDFGDSCGDGYFVDPRKSSEFQNEKSKKLTRAFEVMEECVEKVFGKKPLYLREGASIPLIADIRRLTGLDCMMLGLFLPQDNIHAPNESFSLEMIEKAVAYYEQFFSKITK